MATGSAWRGRRWLCGEMVVVILEGAAAEDGYATGQSKRVSWLPGLLPYPATSALAAAAASCCALARRRHHHIITSCANTRSHHHLSLLFYSSPSLAQRALPSCLFIIFIACLPAHHNLLLSTTRKILTQHRAKPRYCLTIHTGHANPDLPIFLPASLPHQPHPSIRNPPPSTSPIPFASP